MKKIELKKDFSETLGGAYKKEGNYSGEEFRKTVLEPEFIKAVKNDEILVIDLDGTYGPSPSFLEEAFGGLTRKYPYLDINSMIVVISNDEPELAEDIEEYINHAQMHTFKERREKQLEHRK